MICYQCQLEILSFQPPVIRGDHHLHIGCVPDFEAGSPPGTYPLALEGTWQKLVLAVLRNKSTAEAEKQY